MKNFMLFILFLFFAGQVSAQLKLSDEQVKSIIEQQAVIKKAPAIVVGIIDSKGKRIISCGKINKPSDQSPDGNTIFEIGSITKVFTSLLLQIAEDKGELSINDPISKFLPSTVKTPKRDNKEISLIDLSSQVSGLPRMPSNFAPSDYSNPFADYTPSKLYAYLSGCSLKRSIGEKYEYSNLGVGLLGHILSLSAKKDYETLVTKRICEPLEMKSTFITFTPELRKRTAAGYNEAGNIVKNWDFSCLEGAGALKSSVNDLLTFLEANMGIKKSGLYSSMQKIQKVRHKTDNENLLIAMGWHIWNKFGNSIIWHNGGTGGYNTFIGFDDKNKIGIVLLTSGPQNAMDLGMHLIDNRYELSKK